MRSFIVDALGAGKSVVTSNKAVVAAHFERVCGMFRLRVRVFRLIEVTCGGGIPG